jgi:hypothetical protein
VDLENRHAREHQEAQRQKRREAESRREPMTYRLRRKELRRLLQHRYGFDSITDLHHHAHVDVIELAAQMLASPYRDTAEDAVREWCGKCSAPIVEDIMRRAKSILPRRADMNATACGQRVCLSAEERAALGITTFKAFDETPQDATRRRRARKRAAKSAERQRKRPEVTERTCECGQPLPMERGSKRYCSRACQQRAYRVRHATSERVTITVADQLAEQAKCEATITVTAVTPQAPASPCGNAAEVSTVHAIRAGDAASALTNVAITPCAARPFIRWFPKTHQRTHRVWMGTTASHPVDGDGWRHDTNSQEDTQWRTTGLKICTAPATSVRCSRGWTRTRAT